MSTLGFEKYVEPLKVFLGKYREAQPKADDLKRDDESEQPTKKAKGIRDSKSDTKLTPTERQEPLTSSINMAHLQV